MAIPRRAEARCPRNGDAGAPLGALGAAGFLREAGTQLVGTRWNAGGVGVIAKRVAECPPRLVWRRAVDRGPQKSEVGRRPFDDPASV